MKSFILAILLLSSCTKSDKVSIDIKNLYKEPICKNSLKVKEINSIITLGDFVLDPSNNALTNDELIKKFNTELTYKNSKIETLCTFSNYVHQLSELDESIFNAGLVPNKMTGEKWDDQLKFAEATFKIEESMKKNKNKTPTLEEIKQLNELNKSFESMNKKN